MADAPDRLKISMEGVANSYKKAEQAARGMLKAFGEEVEKRGKVSSALAKQLILEGNLTDVLKKKFPISQNEIKNLKAKGLKTNEIIAVIQKYIEAEKKSASQQEKMLSLQHQAILEDKKRTAAINKTKAARKLSIDKLIQELHLNGLTVASVQKEVKWKTLREKVINGNKLALAELNKRVKDHIRSTKRSTQHIHQQKRGYKELALAMAGVNKQGAFAVRNNRNLGGTFSVLRSKLLLASFAFGMVNRSIIELAKIQGRQVEAENRVAQAIIATGGAAGLTGNQIEEYARQLQSVTTFGDEAILGSSALLLTFKRIKDEAFLPAQKAILDVSAAMNVDLKTATIQIGKALNAPKDGLAALNRVGIQFTEMQKRKLTKALLVANSDLEAQTIILKELETQFGGMAEVMAFSTIGSIERMKNALGDLAEEVADNLAPTIIAITDSIRVWAENVDTKTVKLYIDILVNLTATFALLGPVMKVSTVLITGFSAGLKTATVLANLLRIALIKTGIGGSIALLVFLIQKFIKWKTVTQDVSSGLDRAKRSMAGFRGEMIKLAREKGFDGITEEFQILQKMKREDLLGEFAKQTGLNVSFVRSKFLEGAEAFKKFEFSVTGTTGTFDNIQKTWQRNNKTLQDQLNILKRLMAQHQGTQGLTPETLAILAKLDDQYKANIQTNNRANRVHERTIELTKVQGDKVGQTSDKYKEQIIAIDNNILALKEFKVLYTDPDLSKTQKEHIDNLSRQAYLQWQLNTSLKKEAELRSAIEKAKTETTVFKEQFNLGNIKDRIRLGFALSVQDKQKMESMKREIELLGLTTKKTEELKELVEDRIEAETRLADLEAAKAQAMSIMSDLKEMQFARDIEMADQAIAKANEVMNADIEAAKKSSAYKLAQAVGDTKRMKKIEDDARAKSLQSRIQAFEDKQNVQIGQVKMEAGLAMIKALSDFGWLLGAGISVLIAAQADSAIATIKQQQPPKMETGGLIGGRSHSQGGTLIEAEKGEFVMRRSAVEAIGTEALNRMNKTGSAGTNVTVNISGNVMSADYVEGELAEQIKDAVRRGTDFGIV